MRGDPVVDRSRRGVLRAAGVVAGGGLVGTASGLILGDDEGGRPVTGEAVPELSSLDETMLSYLRDRSIPAAALGLARNGEVLLRRGYGWADRDRTDPVRPDALFRIGSISKAITATAVHRLVGDGLLDLDRRVVPLLDVDPPAGTIVDPRVRDITVRHLLRHRGGWDRSETIDPLFDQHALLDVAGSRAPPTTRDVARWVLDRPLQFTPGARRVYSNVGYALLELVVEAVTGRAFTEYVRNEVLAGVESGDDIRPAATLPRERPAREVWYADETTCPNVMASTAEQVTCADGGYAMAPLRAAAGYVASIDGMLGYLREYWLSGHPRAGDRRYTWYFGTIPGAFAWVCHRRDGVDFVALCNRRGSDPKAVGHALEHAIDDIDDWP